MDTDDQIINDSEEDEFEIVDMGTNEQTINDSEENSTNALDPVDVEDLEENSTNVMDGILDDLDNMLGDCRISY